MRIRFCGAAEGVTGSMHLLEVGNQRILMDCGFFQGRREESNQRNRNFAFDPRSIDVVVLSHAHIDHSGNLPGLVKRGFRGPIYTTSATRDLCAVMLMDSAHIQHNDAEFFNRKAAKRGETPIVPLYEASDVISTMERFVSVSYDMTLPIADGVKLTFKDAGHVLGSASITLDCVENGTTKRIVYSGDVGRPEAPLLCPPVPPTQADVLLLESTYGNRFHEPFDSMHNRLAEVIHHAVKHKGKVIIPSFALERAQEVVYALKGLLNQKKIPQIPVYVDSPLTNDITQVYRLHPESLEIHIQKLFEKEDSPFYFPGLRYIRRVEESKALINEHGPMVIISASGMCEAGRILHHLRNNIENEHNTILFVGFQAQHTLGRKIVEGWSEVKIFGISHPVEARVVVLNGLSAHADQHGLLEFALPSVETCENLILVHGERDQSEVLAQKMSESGFKQVHIAEMLETVELS